MSNLVKIYYWLLVVYAWLLIMVILFIGLLAAVFSLFRRQREVEIIKA